MRSAQVLSACKAVYLLSAFRACFGAKDDEVHLSSTPMYESG